MNRAERFYPFKDPVVLWKRGWPMINFSAELSEKGRYMARALHSWHRRVPMQVIEELMRICHAAGYMGSDVYEIPYDGSTITQVCTPNAAGKICLCDLEALRTKPCNRQEVSMFLETMSVFFGGACDLFCKFDEKILEECKYGILRVESLYSLPHLENMNLDQFLALIYANMKEKRLLFGDDFSLVHQCGGIPVDDDPERCIYQPAGFHRKLGMIRIGEDVKDVYLAIRPGIGGACLGIKAVITVDDPRTNLFMVGWQMQLGGDGNYHPAVSEIQVMPLQLDRDLVFREHFLSYDEIPQRNKLSLIQQEISQQLLGGGDVFNTMVSAITTLYQSRGIAKMLGAKGKMIKWLCFHAQEVLDNGGTVNDVVSSARRMYDQRFKSLGWSENGSFWEHHLNDHQHMLYRALSYRKVDQGQIEPVRVIDSQGEMRDTKVTLQRFMPLVSVDGLARVVELMRDMLPSAVIPEAGEADLQLLPVYRHVRRQEHLIASERYEAIKAHTKKFTTKQQRRKK